MQLDVYQRYNGSFILYLLRCHDFTSVKHKYYNSSIPKTRKLLIHKLN